MKYKLQFRHRHSQLWLSCSEHDLKDPDVHFLNSYKSLEDYKLAAQERLEYFGSRFLINYRIIDENMNVRYHISSLCKECVLCRKI